MSAVRPYLQVGRRGGACLKLQKRIAASMFNCGPSKVWLDPNRKDEIAKARTREDLRTLITDKAVKYNVDPRKPKGALPTEVANRRHLIQQKRIHKHRMKQKAEFHRRRAKEQFPLGEHPSLQHLTPEELQQILEKE
mmetsp:Transcript_26760/g.56905  ORF Transcript_26760/g.56905 Transcript_26760/m.56905 type:complete len:137 (+) Transcript_26760:15-425(+)